MNTTLADYANIALWSSMIVYTLAMLAFAWHLASLAPGRAAASAAARVREPELVGVGGPNTAEAYAAQPLPEDGAVSRQRGSVALMLTYLATALLVASVLMRGIAVQRPPWGNMYEFTTAAAAAASLVYAGLAKRNNWQWLGVFVIAPVLLVLGLAVTVLYTEAGDLMPALKSYWLGIHVTVAVLAVGFFTVAAVVGILHLVKARREGATSGKTNFLDSLPASGQLERTAYSLNMIGFILWTFTLIAGSIWAKQAWGAYWQWDPKEIWTFVIWTVYAAYMHGRATAGVDHRRSQFIALAGFVCIILNFTVVNMNNAFSGMHNYSGM